MMGIKIQRINQLVLVVVLLAQTLTHLAWLSISGQVGQFAIPYLMNQGRPLYTSVVENRPPLDALLITLLLRLFPSIEQVLLVRALNLALILALTMMIYALARRLSPHAFAGSAAVLVWFIWEPTYANVLAYFDIWVGLCFLATALIWVLLEKSQRAWLAPFLCGIVLGLATLFKQPAWAGMIVFGLWLLLGTVTHPRRLSVPTFIIGVLIPTLGIMGLFALAGGLQDYIFWNFQRYFGGIPNGQPFTGAFFRKLLLTNALVPVFAVAALQNMDRRWVMVVLLWFAGGATLFPNFGEIYVMGHLPLMSVMSGVALMMIVESLKVANLRRPRLWLGSLDGGHIALVGLLLGLVLGWGWTAVAIYAPHPLGRGKVPAYDEFRPVADYLSEKMSEDDTLYVLPMGDGNAQLYIMVNRMPPGLWSTSHNVFLDIPGFTDHLLDEWSTTPPSWIIVFPDLMKEFEPGITPLMAFLEDHYQQVDLVPAIPFNGDAVIYHLSRALP